MKPQHEWREGGYTFEADGEGYSWESATGVTKGRGETYQDGALVREILRLAARVKELEGTEAWELAAELPLWKERNAALAEEREALIRSRDRLAGELGAARETIAILDASTKAAGGTAPLWTEIHYLSGRLEKASEEIGRLKSELAIERERAAHRGDINRGLRLRVEELLQAQRVSGERISEQKGKVGELLDRVDGLERENCRLRHGINRALKELSLVPLTVIRVDEAKAFLNAAAERTPVPAGGLAVEVEPRFSREELRVATSNACSCGGHGPEDDDACPACLIWHALVIECRAESEVAP